MIAMTSNYAKIGKPPPPVPPRPSKDLVAEALAKSRRGTNVPVRQAPLPPPSSRVGSDQNPRIEKTQFQNVRRSSSIDEKSWRSERTVIFQSSMLNRVNSTSRDSKKEYVSTEKKKEESVEEIVRRTEIDKSEGSPDDDLNDRNHVNTLIDEMFASVLDYSDSDHRPSGDECDEVPERDPLPPTDLLIISPLDKANSTDGTNDCTSPHTTTILVIDNSSSAYHSSDDVRSNALSDSGCALSDFGSDSGQEGGQGREESIAMKKRQDPTKQGPTLDDLQSSVIKTPDAPMKTSIILIPSSDRDGDVASISVREEVHASCLEHAMSTNKGPRVKFDDSENHEQLIKELQSMKREQEANRRQRKPCDEDFVISHSEWVEVDGDEPVQLSSCQITIENIDGNHRVSPHLRLATPESKLANPDLKFADPGLKCATRDLKFATRDLELANRDLEPAAVDDCLVSRLNMSNLQGLPPLPKSLSGFNIVEQQQAAGRSRTQHGYSHHPKSSPPLNGDVGTKKHSGLDGQLAVLRREMYSLRQLDLSLLSQLWSLNESIQDFRQMLQEQDDRVLSPPSPSPSHSSGDEGEGEEFYTPSPVKFRPAPPPPPLRRPSNTSSGTSSV